MYLRYRAPLLFGATGCGLFLVFIFAVGLGAVSIAPSQIFEVLFHALGATLDETLVDPLRKAVILEIRLPRVMLGALIGAGLGIAGALMQGIFRNPLADPGLIGVSSGAALAASTFIVLGQYIVPILGEWSQYVGTPIAAFLGSLTVTYLVWRMGTVGNRVSVGRLLLGGVAINALVGAVIGLLTLVASDTQLRDLTFWSLGSLNGATWVSVGTAAIGILPVVLIAPRLAKALDAWLLGEAEARHLGVDIVRLKRLAVGTTALAVGASVAVAGMIGFIGLVIPHLVRLSLGPGHRLLLPGSALLGALLLVASDIFARTVAVPIEVPIGIVTALGGAPFFLLLLYRSGARELTM